MRQMEYSPESDFNVSYDGKSMVITACGDKESREIRIPPLIDGSAGDGNRKRGVYILSRTAESRSSRYGDGHRKRGFPGLRQSGGRGIVQRPQNDRRSEFRGLFEAETSDDGKLPGAFRDEFFSGLYRTERDRHLAPGEAAVHVLCGLF